MKMQALHSGRLRAAGYDRSQRRLRVELDDGTLLDYTGVGEELWRRLASASSAWSFYRDNIEEEFSARRAASASGETRSNPLDALFGDD